MAVHTTHNRNRRAFLYGLCALIVLTLVLARIEGVSIMGHADYDSYTLQALAWREGRADLGLDYEHLELAEYEGKYYVSFPPFPSVVMLPLTFLFGSQTPDTLVMLLLFLGSYCAAYILARRCKVDAKSSALWSVFLVCGSSYLDISLYGWVWYLAQSMSFLLTLLFIIGITSDKRTAQSFGLIALALAIGCRPFQAVYLPFALYAIIKKNKEKGQGLKKLIPMLLVPALIAIAYGAYNFLRFDNPLEFGHNYLPEFTNAANGQFHISYIVENLKNILRLPTIENGTLSVPKFDGFAFYIANPICILLVIRLLRSEKMQKEDAILLLSLLAHFCFLLMHKSFGGWQFGTRYMCDVLPVVFYLCVKRAKRTTAYEKAIMFMGIGVNVLGTVWFRQ